MFYAKFSLGDNTEIKVDAGKLDFSGVCYICGKEVPLEDEMPSDYDFYGHEYVCDDCDQAVKPFIVPVEGETYSVYNYRKILAEADIESDLFNWALEHASKDELDIAQAYVGSNTSKDGCLERFDAICNEQDRREKKEGCNDAK